MRSSGKARAFFVVVMLAFCCTACWYALSTVSLRAENVDLTTKLTTSRQRETKQQLEYDAVSVELPQTQAELAEAQPLADAAKARENELRAQRKQLRADVAELQAAVDALEQENARLKEAIAAMRQVMDRDRTH